MQLAFFPPVAMRAAPLAEFSAKLRAGGRDGGRGTFDSATRAYPMYTVPADALLQMDMIRKHEDMLEAGALVEFEEEMGRAMFISHQWLSARHPDPNAEQLKILQQALRNIISGASRVHVAVVTEIYNGRSQCPTAESFHTQSLYIWFDYCCCPQGTSESAALSRQSAIDSIPVYVARCYYFVILCPALRHLDDDSMMSQSSWVERGWCRTPAVPVHV